MMTTVDEVNSDKIKVVLCLIVLLSNSMSKLIHSISRSPKLPHVLLQLDKSTVHVFYFLNIDSLFIE